MTPDVKLSPLAVVRFGKLESGRLLDREVSRFSSF
jgi:hypothetical protein